MRSSCSCSRFSSLPSQARHPRPPARRRPPPRRPRPPPGDIRAHHLLSRLLLHSPLGGRKGAGVGACEQGVAELVQGGARLRAPGDVRALFAKVCMCVWMFVSSRKCMYVCICLSLLCGQPITVPAPNASGQAPGRPPSPPPTPTPPPLPHPTPSSAGREP